MGLKYRNTTQNVGGGNAFINLSSIPEGNFIVPTTNRAFSTLSISGVGTQAFNNIKAAALNVVTSADAQIDIESPAATRIIFTFLRSSFGWSFKIFSDDNSLFNLQVRNNSAGANLSGQVISTADTPTEIGELPVDIVNPDAIAAAIVANPPAVGISTNPVPVAETMNPAPTAAAIAAAIVANPPTVGANVRVNGAPATTANPLPVDVESTIADNVTITNTAAVGAAVAQAIRERK